MGMRNLDGEGGFIKGARLAFCNRSISKSK
jgi:hypothetical protein